MLKNIFKNSFKKTLLGRWSLSSDKVTAIKVNWANVDHCGTCSQEDVKANYKIPSKPEKNLDEIFYCVEAYHEPINAVPINVVPNENEITDKTYKKRY
jgi:hypothetical protein